MSNAKYWIIVASKDHASIGRQQGIAQACHGKEAPLKRMKTGDWVVIYSSKDSFPVGEKYQKFTAIGRVKDDSVYQFAMTDNFKPYRRNITYYDCEEVSILPLINQLTFIKNKQQWGYPFRFGLFEISAHDFDIIAGHMLQHATV